MEGQILGYQTSNDEGVIKAEDGNRYTFKKEDWKADNIPQQGQGIDFDLVDGKAKDIYISVASTAMVASDNNTNAIISLLLTVFLGVIGTLVSRLAFAKQDFGIVWLPALLHLLSALLWIIPVFGWLAGFGVNIYFAVSNYKIVNSGIDSKAKYA